jgi:tryptophan halogenase
LDNSVKKIVIIGGGMAGWLTALSIVKFLKNVECTLIESSTIGSIGVGEGTTGLFLEYISSLGIDVSEFMQKTDALPKYGINFLNWTGNNSNFYSPIDGSYYDNDGLDLLFFGAILNDLDVNGTSRFLTVIDENKTDIFLKDNLLESRFKNFALHLDTFKTIEYLKNYTLNNFNNIKCIDRVIEGIELSNTGSLSTITLADKNKISGDFFIDCSGLAKIAIKHLNPKWIDYSNELIVNTAIPFTLKNDLTDKKTFTTARAMNSGWVWEIPTKKRIGRGYIFNDSFISEQDALNELEEFYKMPVEKVKTIKFSSGRLDQVWIKNCVAVGLSAAFLEPLQATSIHCTIVQLNDLIKNFLNCPLGTLMSEENAADYNNRISKLYSGMADFVSMHYSGGRNDTKFWQHISNNQKIRKNSKKIIEKAKFRLTRSDDFEVHAGFAGMHMWNYSLYGLGHIKKEVVRDILSNINFDFSQLPTHIKYFKEETRNLLLGALNIKDIEKLNE